MDVVDKPHSNFYKRVVKVSFIIFTPLLLVLLSVFSSIYYIHNKARNSILREQINQHLTHTQLHILLDLHTVSKDLDFLANHHDWCDLNKSGLKSKPRADILNDFSRLSTLTQKYDQIRFIDTYGYEKLRVNLSNEKTAITPPSDLQFKGHRYYFKDSIDLERGNIMVSPLDLNIENKKIEKPLKPMIRFATPVFNAKGEKQGVLVLNYLAKELIEGIKLHGMKKKGTTTLINNNGYWLKGFSIEDEWGFMFPERKSKNISNRFPKVWEAIKTHKHGKICTGDGLFTFTSIHPFSDNFISTSGSSTIEGKSEHKIKGSDYHWILLHHISRGELYTQRRRELTWGIIGALILIFFMASTSFRYALTIVNRKIAEEKLRIKNQELEKALLEIKTLQGIIPVCANCHKIMNDEGGWEHMEKYIREHSCADFSHTVCPECSQKLYPELSHRLYKNKKAPDH